MGVVFFFFFSSRRRHTRFDCDWSSDVCSSDLVTKRAMAPLVTDNPHLAEVVTLEPGEPIRHLARRLRALAPTHGLDLHGSVRSASLRMLVGCRWSGYRKRKLARALLIATKLDAYRRRAPSPVGEIGRAHV